MAQPSLSSRQQFFRPILSLESAHEITGKGIKMFRQISPNEKQNLIELVMVHTQGTPAELERVRKVLQEKSVDELQSMAQRIRLKVQTEATRYEYVKLQLVKAGLANTDQNWQKIDTRLPGSSLTVENFRRLVESDPQFKADLTWTAEPFAEANREEQQQSSRYRAQRSLFDACANAVTGQGIVNVAANDANFGLVNQALEEDGLDFTQDNVINLLVRGGLQLASNDKDSSQELDQKSREHLLGSIESRIAHSEYRYAIRQYIQTSTYQQLLDRVTLCAEIADNHSPEKQVIRDRMGREVSVNTQHVNNAEFCILLLSKKSNEEFRQQVEQLRENKKFAKMSPLEIKKYLQEKQTAQQPSHENRVAAEIISPTEQKLLEAANNDPRPALPERTSHGEEIDTAYLNQLQRNDFSAYRELLQRHGRIRLEARIRGVK